jgi:hypothetical protein
MWVQVEFDPINCEAQPSKWSHRIGDFKCDLMELAAQLGAVIRLVAEQAFLVTSLCGSSALRPGNRELRLRSTKWRSGAL